MKFLVLLAFTSVLAEDPSQLLKDFSVGNIQFTADLYTKLKASKNDNFIVSPLSLEIVLAVTQDGARGQTARQLSSGLHLPGDQETIQKMFSQLTSTLKSNNDEYQLSSANKIYVKDGIAINTGYKRKAVDVFAAEVENINFDDSIGSAAKMNKWVEAKTQGKITNLVSPELLDKQTLIVLINAMYFHGKWEWEFDPNWTDQKSFHLNSKQQVNTDTMRLLEHGLNYYESIDLNAKFLELPYLGGVASMVVVLPNDVEGLSILETRIADVFAAPKFKEEYVLVELPKFKTESTVDFVPILSDLGMRNAFNGNADFSGIFDTQYDIKIDTVLQKAYIEVGEAGTTAAAASFVGGGGGGWGFDPKYFIADHPFLYYLKHESKIVFVGRYISP